MHFMFHILKMNVRHTLFYCLFLVLTAGLIAGSTQQTPAQADDGVSDGAAANITLKSLGKEKTPESLEREISYAGNYITYFLRKNTGLDEILDKLAGKFSRRLPQIKEKLEAEGITELTVSYENQRKEYTIPPSDKGYVIEFTGEPKTAYEKRLAGQGLSNARISSSVSEYGKTLNNAHISIISEIEGLSDAIVGRSFKNVFNGVAVDASATDVEAILKIPGVKAAYPMREYRALLYDSVEQIGADAVWALSDVGGRNITGLNVTVAVIDTGVDYTHPDFGGCPAPAENYSGEVVDMLVESDHPYANYASLNWTIQQPGFTQISVHFERIDVESGYDTVYVKYPNGTTAQTFTGSHEDVWSYSVPGDMIIVSLSSDGSVTDWGFKADKVLNGTVTLVWNCSKVVGGYDFVNNDGDPMDDQGHGTHCAGIIAANGTVRGVAPGAGIMAYKVLDSEGYGMTDNILAALERAVDPNQDGNFSDRVDVISMSLGGSGDPFDDLSTAVDNAVGYGVVVAVAAGNDGPDEGTISSPGCARKAITVGAVHKANQSQGMGNSSLTVVSEQNLVLPSLALEYSNTTGLEGITRKLEYAGLGYPENFSGVDASDSIVLMDRGELYYYEKVANAFEAGAVGVVIANNFPGNFYGTLLNDSAIPAVSVSQENGTYLKNLLENKSVQVNITVLEEYPTLADFSSRGPAHIYNKPDVVAPGVLICSAQWADAFNDSGVPCVDGEHVAISGTSMATPHVAGAAALLLQAHPDWTPLEVKAALENTAVDEGLSLNEQGAGLISVYDAAVLLRPPPVAYISNLTNLEYV